jgi:AraC-like DNA-binding protein
LEHRIRTVARDAEGGANPKQTAAAARLREARSPMTTSLSDLLRSVSIVHADFALVDLRRGGGFRIRDRERMQLHLMVSGAADFAFPDNAQLVRLERGQYLFAPPGVAHAASVTGATATTFESLEPPRPGDQPVRHQLGEGVVGAQIITCSIELDQTRHAALLRLAPEIRAYRRRQGPTVFLAEPLVSTEELGRLVRGSGATALLTKVAELLLVHAMRDSLLHGASPATGLATPDAPQIAAALRLIYEHPERDWSVGSLAREVGMSRSVFATAFAQRLDETPIRYITHVRMLRAQLLLKDGGRSLAQIAHLTGYISEAAFARAFKREFGETPGAYRREIRAAITADVASDGA